MTVYDDNFWTCVETFTTFRIFSRLTSARDISQRLGVEPSYTHAVGDPVEPLGNLEFVGRHREHAWFLCSKEHVVSRDTRRHLDWVLDRLEPSLRELRKLLEEGARMDVMGVWGSESGEGGPIITPRQMERLAPFGVQCWWDVYFDGNDSTG